MPTRVSPASLQKTSTVFEAHTDVRTWQNRCCTYQIYQLYPNGLSFGKIKQILEGEGIIGSKKTGEWSLGKIEYILKNEKYCGKYALSEILICGDCCTPYKRVTWARNGKNKIVWRCINHIDYGTKYCHISPTIEESKPHAAIVSAIQALSLNSDYKLEIIRQNVMDIMNESDDNRSAHRHRIR